MADFSPTPQQLDAISARGSALLISAGAGSGKTRVLTERLMSYLTDASLDLDVTDFLIITYTRAAAAELRARILSAISDELRKNPKNRRLRRQAKLAHHAEIDTIHSFCGRLVRENAHHLGVPPDFRVAEQSECDTIKSAVMSSALDARYENISSYEGFEQLVDTLSPGRDDSLLAQTALEVFEKLRSHEDSDKWISEQLLRLNPEDETEVSETPWGALLLKKARDTAVFWLHRVDGLIEELDASTALMKKYGDCLSLIQPQLLRFIDACNNGWDSAMAAASFSFERAKSNKLDIEDCIKSHWAACRNDLKAITDSFIGDSCELISDMKTVFPATKALFELVTDFTARYQEEKAKRRIVDFSDLEHFALALLTGGDERTPLALEVAARYCEIMIDEYQDVSAIQERIFGAVSENGRNLVMVGDVRQSIYRFRLAEPGIFLNKYQSFSDDPNACGRRIILADNFRSRANVIDAVNYVFCGVMSQQFGEMDYTEREFLRAGRADAAGGEPVEFRIIAPESTDDDAPDRRELEAQYVARRILELTAEVYAYSDIVILIRSRTYAHLYRDALAALGIPVETDEADSLLDTYEVKVALAFLNIIDNPRNDIALISVLRFMDFSADELAEVRLCDRENGFYDALTLYAEQSEKARRLLSLLSELRALAPALGADGVLWQVYNRTNMPALMSLLPDGDARRSNLTQLASEARNAATFGYSGVFEFLRYLERLRSPIGCLSSHSSGGVRIMSVHKSKGLEFPVVFLVDLAHRFNMQDQRKRLLFHPELGAGQKLVDLRRRIEYPTLPRLAIAEKLADEAKAEELRVLYVAMTRAREKLIMVYSDNEPQRTLEKLREDAQYPLSPQTLRRQPSIGNILLLPLLSRPESAGFDNAGVPSGLFDMKIVCISPKDTDSFAPEQVSEFASFPEEVPPEPSYSHPIAPTLPSKLTVTELKNRAYDAELVTDAEIRRPSKQREVFRKPAFITDSEKLSGAELGTALHTALRHIPIREYSDIPELRREIDALSERGLITAAECAAVDESRIMHLLESPLGKRIIGADELLREFKFSLLVPAEEFFEGGGDDEILFQGVLDLAFRESDRLCVVDFKTDRLYSENALFERTADYTPQIKAYMNALRRVSGLQVCEGYIYFFDGDITVNI